MKITKKKVTSVLNVILDSIEFAFICLAVGLVAQCTTFILLIYGELTSHSLDELTNMTVLEWYDNFLITWVNSREIATVILFVIITYMLIKSLIKQRFSNKLHTLTHSSNTETQAASVKPPTLQLKILNNALGMIDALLFLIFIAFAVLFFAQTYWMSMVLTFNPLDKLTTLTTQEWYDGLSTAWQWAFINAEAIMIIVIGYLFMKLVINWPKKTTSPVKI